MKHLRSRKGFTLIEMLVVIAIIAVLVAIIIPTVVASTDKAKAAADAANLRGILGKMNAVLITGAEHIDSASRNEAPMESKLKPGAKLHVLYTRPGVIDVFFVDGEGDDARYYGLEYLAQVAQGQEPTASTEKPAIDLLAGDAWYIIGEGKVE